METLIHFNSGDSVLKVEQDDLNRRKYLVGIFKGVSLADPERYEINKLIMFRFKITIKGVLSKFVDTKLQKAIELIEQTDIDLKLLESFFETKWDRKQIIKFFNPLLEVYQVVKPGEKLGELEMDHDTFTGMLKFFKVLSYETFKSENVIR